MSQVKIIKNKTVAAEVFLNCSEEGEHHCAILRDALLKNVSAMNSAETVESIGSGTKFCVTGTALVQKNEVLKFKQDIEKLKKSLRNKGIRINNSKVLLQKAIS